MRAAKLRQPPTKDLIYLRMVRTLCRAKPRSRLVVILSGGLGRDADRERWRSGCGLDLRRLVAYLCANANAPLEEKPHAVLTVAHSDFSAA